MKIVAVRIVRFNREFVSEYVRTDAERAREWRQANPQRTRRARRQQYLRRKAA